MGGLNRAEPTVPVWYGTTPKTARRAKIPRSMLFLWTQQQECPWGAACALEMEDTRSLYQASQLTHCVDLHPKPLQKIESPLNSLLAVACRSLHRPQVRQYSLSSSWSPHHELHRLVLGGCTLNLTGPVVSLIPTARYYIASSFCLCCSGWGNPWVGLRTLTHSEIELYNCSTYPVSQLSLQLHAGAFPLCVSIPLRSPYEASSVLLGYNISYQLCFIWLFRWIGSSPVSLSSAVLRSDPVGLMGPSSWS